MKGVNLLSKTHRNDKSNLKLRTVLQELLQVDRLIAIIFAGRVITINREYDKSAIIVTKVMSSSEHRL